MDYINLESRAKINLGLDVIDKRSDGYHNIKTIMQEIDLRDRLKIERIDKGFIVQSQSKDLPRGEDNIVYKAWQLMQETYKLSGGIKIHIEKNIPMGAGLAGGSSNAGATIEAIDKLWGLNLDQKTREEIGIKLGADVPFCLRGGTLLAQALGNDFSQLESFRGVRVLLVNPNFPISTELVYKDLKTYGDGSKIDEIKKNLDRSKPELLKDRLYNRMEDQVFRKHPSLESLKKELISQGAVASLMSGSGPTIFGIFKDDESWDQAYLSLRQEHPDYLVIKTKTL